MKTNIKVKQWLAIVMVGLFTFLSVIQAVPIGTEGQGLNIQEVEASGKFNNSELTSVLPSAYYETKNAVTGDEETFDEKSKQFKTNVRKVADEHYGNVGLFVGFPGESDSQLSALNTSNALSINESNNQFKSSDVKRYYAFGAAVQNISKKGIKSKKVEESAQKTVDGIANSAKSLTKAGARLIENYNPTPILLSLYLTEGGRSHDNNWVAGIPSHINLANYPDNKLVQIIQNNESLSSILKLVRVSPTGSETASMTLFSWIVFGMVIMLIITGVLMKVINGRAAGENYRKAVVKIFISSLAIPLMATLLHYGVETFVDVTDPDITPEEEHAEKAIGEHLNFADWYATGFAVPEGISLKISDERFILSQDQIRAINNYSYGMVVGGGSEPSAEKVYERLMTAGDQNFAQPSYIEKDGWDGMTMKKVGDTIVSNDEDVDIEKSMFSDADGSYMHGFRNEMSPGSDGEYTVSGNVSLFQGYTSGDSVNYGMSPLASYNMMRSSFSGGNITSSLAKPQMASVVYSAYVGSNGREMNGIVKLIATYAMIMAAMKGLASIFASGIGGIFSGAVRGGLGSTAGMGQGIGGIIALVAGVLGMGLIMNISFIFLDELYSIFFDIFKGTTAGDPTMLDPLKDMVDDLPGFFAIFKPFLKGALENIATLVITIASAIALPKFGKIPINLFSQKMSELPSSFAEKAQRMENRFTGDYRAGATGRGGSSAAFNSQVSQIAGDTKNQMAGVGEAAAAGGGMILGLAGGGIASLGDRMMGDTEEGDMSIDGDPDDNGGGPDGDGSGGEESINAIDQNFEGEERVDEDNLDGDEGNDVNSLEGDKAGKGEDKTGLKEGGSKDSISNSKSEKATQASSKDLINGAAGKNESIEGDSKTIDSSKEKAESTNIEGNQSVAGDKNFDENLNEKFDSGGEYASNNTSEGASSQQNVEGAKQEIDGNQSIAGEKTNLDQSGGVNQSYANEQKAPEATPSGGASIGSTGQTNISNETGGKNQQFDGNNTQTLSQSDKHQTAVDAKSNVNSNLSANEKSINQQSQDIKQDSNSFVKSQRSSVNTGGNSQGKSVTGQNKQTSGTPSGGRANIHSGNSKSQTVTNQNKQSTNQNTGSKSVGNLKNGTPTMNNKSNNPQTKNQNTQRNTNQKQNNVNQSTRNNKGMQSVNTNQNQNAPNKPTNNQTNTNTQNTQSTGGNAKVPNKNTSFKMKAGKFTRAVGKGMQSAGGEVSVDRAVKAAKHGASAAFIGGHAQQRTQTDLNRAQGKVNVPRTNSVNQQTNQNTNAGMDRRQSDILRQEETIEDQERYEEGKR